jgi:thioredoxin-related protein
MKLFKNSPVLLGVALLLVGGSFASRAQAAASAWTSDFPAAVARAKAENKRILINFTGSDWCPWCFKLRDEVFAMPEFTKYADANLVLVVTDFPRKTSLPAALQKANEDLARKYGITGFPTVVVLDQNEKKLAQLGYQPGGPRAFIAQIPAATSGAATGPAAPMAVAGTLKATPPAPAPVLVSPAPVALPKEVTLKAILGGKNPLVIINSKTLGVGEETRIKLADREVKVRIEKIAEKSAVLSIDGERKELQLNGQ